MGYQKDLKEIREICKQIDDPYICLSWLEDRESLERLGITSIEAVEQVYNEIQAENKHVYSNIESALVAMSKEKHSLK